MDWRTRLENAAEWPDYTIIGPIDAEKMNGICELAEEVLADIEARFGFDKHSLDDALTAQGQLMADIGKGSAWMIVWRDFFSVAAKGFYHSLHEAKRAEHVSRGTKVTESQLQSETEAHELFVQLRMQGVEWGKVVGRAEAARFSGSERGRMISEMVSLWKGDYFSQDSA